MSDRELNHELNDELLSAYLDGELTDAERAAVEARLATDPEAKHTLQQLRMVSQSVQALPQESIGRDLREQVLRRVEQKKPAARGAAADGGTLRLGDTMPQITIFRTRRSWVWASLVVAAGLLIMFQQSGDEHNKNLPALAKHDSNGTLANAPVAAPMRRSLGEREATRAIEAEKIAKTESPAPAASPPPTSVASDRNFKKLPAPAGPAGLSALDKARDEIINGSTAGAPVAAASPAAKGPDVELGANRESRVALDDAGKLSAGKPPLGRELGAERQVPYAVGGGGAVGGALRSAESQRQEQLVEQNRLVVVHVVAKPESFKNKAFDQLLVDNGIKMESPSDTGGRSGVTDGRITTLSETERAADKSADVRTAGGQNQNVDIVLVEAPQSAIVSCMEGLKKDLDNYVGIEVDQPPADKDRADLKSLQNKKVSDDLRGYSRGVVPERQKELFREQQSQYGFNTFGGSSDSTRGLGGDLNGGKDAVTQKAEREPLGRQQASIANQGRARRYLYTDEQNRRGGEAVAGSEAARDGAAAPVEKSPPLQQARQAKAKEETEDMQVLFLVSPDSGTAASVPTEKAAK